MSRKLHLAALALTLIVAAANPAAAQQDAPAQSKDDQRLEALLSEADLFYKKSYVEGSQRWEYKIAFAQDGDTTMMAIYLRSLGNYGNGDPINVVYAWTQVTGAPDGQLPPAVIKAIANLNDTLPLGNFSASKNGTFANMAIVMQDLTKDSLYLSLWQLHYNALFLKKELDGLQ